MPERGLRVSTVRLPIPHPGGLYETMVFPTGKWNDLYCERYETEDAAKEGHRRVVEMVLSGEISA